MADLTLKKGYTIDLAGEAPREFLGTKTTKLVGIQPPNFKGFKPKLAAREGDEVSIGSPLLYEKNNPEIKFTSPVSGRVKAINRGARRAILSITVEPDGQDKHASFEKVQQKAVSEIKREEILDGILESGLFPFFVQRPFGTLADPSVVPRDIFISAVDKAPLATDPTLEVQGNEQAFAHGTKIINKLTSGAVHLTIEKQNKKLISLIQDPVAAVPHTVTGQHPAGNVGVQIHHISPIKARNDVVWTIGIRGVIMIGKLFLEGKLDPQITVSVSGSDAKNPGYYKTTLGAQISDIIGNDNDENKSRIISGNVLTGQAVGSSGFVGFYHNSITIIPEVTEPGFFLTDGWASPGMYKQSYWGTFLGKWLNPRHKFVKDTCLQGGKRNFVITGHYSNVVPMDIYPEYLIKSIMYKDIEEMEGLGIYEVIEEDLALCEYICPSKVEMQTVLREGLDFVEKEG